MSLRPGPLTFSSDRLRGIWRDLQSSPKRTQYESYTIINHHSESELPSRQLAEKLCLQFYEDVQDPKTHLDLLAARYSLTCMPGLPKMKDPDFIEDFIVDKAEMILGQLPAYPPEIFGVLHFDGRFESGYLISGLESGEKSLCPDFAWQSLAAVRFVDTVVLRLLLQSLAFESLDPPRSGCVALVNIMNATIQLLRVSLNFASAQRPKDGRWIVICVFLWTSWQRLLMLEFRCHLGRHLRGGYSCEAQSLGSIRALDVVPEVFEYRKEVLYKELRKTPYLCSWAYQSLVNDWACLSTDLRRFHQVHSDSFGQRRAICNPGSEQCSGSSSVSCGRFENTTVINQSAHTRACEGDCPRLFWVRESFVSVTGPKAVDILATDANGLRYCASTEKTLTISHVWSHGQGGRPDHSSNLESTGFNLCLHRRYSEIASSLGYTSYWMDTPCIPSEKDLRWQCISQITTIFSASEVTLICDRDIMTVDISTPDVEAYEKALSILLVCDWNMRAWTLLESMRGRRSLYLLCLDDKILNLYEALQTVYTCGRLDVAVLFLTRSYVLPPDEKEHFELFEGLGSVYTEKEHEEAGFLTINHAAVLLSSRHATRDDDDLLVWSLLTGDQEIYDPIEMWRRRIGDTIPTGSLVSSAPRLTGYPGFRWAPSRPMVPRRSVTTTKDDRFFAAYDGVDTKSGRITKKGLLAKWQTFKFEVSATLDNSVSDHPQHRQVDSLYSDRLADITRQFLVKYTWGILLQPIHTRGLGNKVVPYQGSSDNILVVCGSYDGTQWEWRGVYAWSRSAPLPQFRPREILLA